MSGCSSTAIEEQEMEDRLLEHLEECRFLSLWQPQAAAIGRTISCLERRDSSNIAN
jgi:hypothetical protein